MKRCIINVAIGEPYTSYQERLIKSIIDQMPGTRTMFWRDSLPEGSRSYKESMYGFKMYAFQEAFKHYDSVIWLDSPTVLHTSIAPVFDLLESQGELVVGTKSKLYQYVNDTTLNYYGLDRQKLKDENWALNYGFVFGFTKDRPTYQKMFAGERAGLFSTAAEDYHDHIHNTGQAFNGEYVEHRHEESILSCIVQMEGRKMIPLEELEKDTKYFSFEKTPL